MQPNLTPTFAPDMGSHQANLANEDALAAYQRALKEHVVIQRAIEGGHVTSTPAVKKQLDAHIKDCQRRGVDSISPKEVARFAFSLMAKPSALFPQIAQEIEKEANSINVDGLVKLFNPDYNRKMSSLDGESKGYLKALGSNTCVVKTLQCELLHEMQFPTGSSVNGIAHRIEKWIDSGTGQAQRSARWGVTAGVAIAAGPSGLLGLTVNNLADYLVKVKEIGISRSVKGVFESTGSLMGKGKTAGRRWLKASTDFLERHGNTPKGCIVLGIGALAVTYAAIYGADNLSGIADNHLDDLVFAAKSMKYDFPLASDSTWVNVLAGGFFGSFAKRVQDRFNFGKAISPLKSDPYHVPEPIIPIVESRSSNAENTKEYKPDFSVEPLQEVVIGNSTELGDGRWTGQKRQPLTPHDSRSLRNVPSSGEMNPPQEVTPQRTDVIESVPASINKQNSPSLWE